MKTDPVPPTTRRANWIPFPDPIKESEAKIDFNWTADERTRQAIGRQTAVMGFESPEAYLHQLIAAVLSGNDESTVLTDDGRLGLLEHAYDRDGVPRDL